MDKWEAKDKRITILSLFRDLTDIKDYNERLDKAIELSHRVFLEVPPEPEISPELRKPIEKIKKITKGDDEPPF